jgi:hypothetical protein
MAEWANFYTLLGTGAATLLGLTFLALTFGGKLNSPERIRHVPLFVTPTVVHFSMVLLISAAMLIPDLASEGSMGLIALAGVSGAAYMVWLGWRFFHSQLEAVLRFTWIWHAGVPGLVYLCLTVAALWSALADRPHFGAIAAPVLMLMGIALRDSWATVEWIAQHMDQSTRD